MQEFISLCMGTNLVPQKAFLIHGQYTVLLLLLLYTKSVHFNIIHINTEQIWDKSRKFILIVNKRFFVHFKNCAFKVITLHRKDKLA